MQVVYIFDPSIPPFGWARITRPTGWGCVVDIKKEPKINKWYVYRRYLLRFFDCLAHPNLSETFATDQI